MGVKNSLTHDADDIKYAISIECVRDVRPYHITSINTIKTKMLIDR